MQRSTTNGISNVKQNDHRPKFIIKLFFRQFNLTIKGTNMASASSYQNIIIHMLDVNDNPPFFIETDYYGQIYESSQPGSYVSSNDSLNR